ncbi:MAG: GTPase HflX [Gammaproteobacteria bacterium]|nr:GTPase HflX [Gammaproteobacteria bacterium]
MFERHAGGENAVLVHIDLPDIQNREDKDEFVELAVSAGLEIKAIVGGSRKLPEPRYFIGTGKADEIAQLVEEHQADVVLFNHRLSPAQERNIERLVKCRVIDRTGLILDIFAQRAQTHEGKLQVELAQLNHLSTRLVRGWTHLERQKGGIGLRGPGETQLETDRRLLRERVKTIEKRLEKVEKQREQGRRSRKRGQLSTVAIVGYTNAGKSTLFNLMTDSKVYAADQLFATLDPTLRKIELGDGQSVILSDTVGFIRHLPHDLVAAFKATLQESRQADILLHIIDASDDRKDDNIEQVNQVLAEIGADHIKTIAVYNKIDRLEQVSAKYNIGLDGNPDEVWCSAVTGEGIELIKQSIANHLAVDWLNVTVRLTNRDYDLRSELYNLKAVEKEVSQDDASILLDIRINQADWQRLLRKSDGRLEKAAVATI